MACETFAPLSQGKRFPGSGPLWHMLPLTSLPVWSPPSPEAADLPGQELPYSPLKSLALGRMLAGSVCTQRQADLGEEGCRFWGQEAAGMEPSARFRLGCQNLYLGDSP